MSEYSSVSLLLQETTKYSSNLIPFETNKLEIVHTNFYIAMFPKSQKEHEESFRVRCLMPK